MCMHTNTLAHTHTDPHTHAHDTHTTSLKHTHTHTHTHTTSRTHTHILTRMHTHTHAHSHTLSRSFCCPGTVTACPRSTLNRAVCPYSTVTVRSVLIARSLCCHHLVLDEIPLQEGLAFTSPSSILRLGIMLAPSLPRPNKGRGGEGAFFALGRARFVLCWV